MLYFIKWETQFSMRFKETENIEDRQRSGRPCFGGDRVHFVKSVMEKMTAKISTRCSSAREPERIKKILESSIRCVFHEVLCLYPYKIQTLHQLLPADIDKELK